MAELSFQSSIRGYHIYRSVWQYRIGDVLTCEIEEGNPNDKFAVKLTLKRGDPNRCVGHVPIEFSKIFNFFLKRGGRISAEVTGDNFFGNGLEVPCVYKFSGVVNDIAKLKILLKL